MPIVSQSLMLGSSKSKGEDLAKKLLRTGSFQ
jgi:hypothetical protein